MISLQVARLGCSCLLCHVFCTCGTCGLPFLPQQKQELWLYSNELTKVPKELAQLTGLKRLWLDRNRLASVPAELAQLTNLQVGGGAAHGVGAPCHPAHGVRLRQSAMSGPHLPACCAPECGPPMQSICAQELYLDQNPDLAELPPALALLPALRRMYVASTAEAQAALQAQAAAVHQGPGGGGPAAAAVAAGVIQQSRPFA